VIDDGGANSCGRYGSTDGDSRQHESSIKKQRSQAEGAAQYEARVTDTPLSLRQTKLELVLSQTRGALRFCARVVKRWQESPIFWSALSPLAAHSVALHQLYCATPTPTVLRYTYTNCIVLHLHQLHCATPTPTALRYTYTNCIALHLHQLHCATPAPTALRYTCTNCIALHLHQLHCATPTPTALRYTYTNCTALHQAPPLRYAKGILH
jgi:hypothetical protein